MPCHTHSPSCASACVVEGTVLPGSPSITRSDDHRVLTGTGRPLSGRTHGLGRTWARRVSGSSLPPLLVVPVTPTRCAAQPAPDRPPVCRTLPEKPGHWGRGYPVDKPLLACAADASPPAASPLSPRLARRSRLGQGLVYRLRRARYARLIDGHETVAQSVPPAAASGWCRRPTTVECFLVIHRGEWVFGTRTRGTPSGPSHTDMSCCWSRAAATFIPLSRSKA